MQADQSNGTHVAAHGRTRLILCTICHYLKLTLARIAAEAEGYGSRCVCLSVCLFPLNLGKLAAGFTVTKRRIQNRNHEFSNYYELKSSLKWTHSYNTDTTFTYMFRKRYSRAESRAISQRASSTRAIYRGCKRSARHGKPYTCIILYVHKYVLLVPCPGARS